MRPPSDPQRPIKPEELAAYADGELDAADRQRVEEWLARHPAAAAEVEALRRLDRLWHDGVPPEPSEADWSAALGSLEARLRQPYEPSFGAAAAPGRRRNNWFAWALGVSTAAAVIFLALVLHQAWDEPFAVASADDVEIISVDASDSGTLVVGEPPVQEPLVLASADDVTLERLEPDVDGMVPEVRGDSQGGGSPMVVAPFNGGLAHTP